MRTIGEVGTWPILPALTVTVAGFVLIALTGATIVPRLIPRTALRSDNEVKGLIISIMGVLYAVVLGFVAIGVWERFDQAEVRTYDEASNLAELYRDADMFSQRDRLRSEIRAYTREVVAYDWPAMAVGNDAPRTRGHIERIGALVRALSVRDTNRENVQAQMLESLHALLADRDARLSMSATGLDPLMWTVLFIGAVATIGSTYILGFRSRAAAFISTAGLGAMIGLVLYLTVSLDFPFRGAISIAPDAFSHAYGNYRLIDGSR